MLNIVLRSRVSKWGWELLCLQAWPVSSTWITRSLITLFNNLFLWLHSVSLSRYGEGVRAFPCSENLAFGCQARGAFPFPVPKRFYKMERKKYLTGRLHSYLVDLISTRCLPLPQEEGQHWPLLPLLPALVLILFNLCYNSFKQSLRSKSSMKKSRI